MEGRRAGCDRRRHKIEEIYELEIDMHATHAKGYDMVQAGRRITVAAAKFLSFRPALFCPLLPSFLLLPFLFPLLSSLPGAVFLGKEKKQVCKIETRNRNETKLNDRDGDNG